MSDTTTLNQREEVSRYERILRRDDHFHAVSDELDHAYAKHGDLPWGRHEFYAILKEEVDELWDAIKRDEPQENVIAEIVDVTAMCFRYIETGDRYRTDTLIHTHGHAEES